MKWKKITYWVVLGSFSVMLLWDLFIVFKYEPATISNMMIVVFHKYPFVTFLFGYVMGHLTWRMPRTKEVEKVLKDFDVIKK